MHRATPSEERKIQDSKSLYYIIREIKLNACLHIYHLALLRAWFEWIAG